MTDDSLLPFHLPAVQRKKVTAAFDGGLISSDGGLVLLRETERRLGLADTLAGCIRDRRNQAQVVHTLAAMLRFRMLAIACGYEDADDCDALRTDPLFKLAVGHAPESGRDLCLQPTMSRLENAPSRIEVARMTAALGRHLLPQLPSPSRRHHPRHRRHLRSRAWPAAVVAVPRPLRHPLLPARPRLPCGKRQAGGGPPAPGQDALGCGGPHPPQAPGPAHPPALAAHPDRLPGRFPLRPYRGHGLVRGERRRLHLRPGGQSRAARTCIRRGRRPQAAPRPRPAQRRCGPSPPSPTPPVPGAANAGSSPGWRRPRAASTPAISSPR